MSQDNHVGQSLKGLGAGAAAGAGEPSPDAADPAPVPCPAAAAPVATTKLPASLPAVASRGRQKPLLQLLALVAARAHVLGLLLLLASVCGLLALPLLDRAVRFDEKGLLAGLAAPTIGQAAAGGQLMRAARRIARAATATTAATTSKGRTVAAFQSPAAPAALAAALAAAGLTETQLTRPLVRMTGPLLPNSSASSGPSPGAAAVRPGWCRCANLHVLVRARRGDGLEALAVVTPVAFAPPAAADAALDGWAQTAAGAELGLAAGAALALHLAAPAEAAGGGGRWLSRDVLWVVPDLSCGVSACLAAWVDSYTGGAGGGGRDGGDAGGAAAGGGGLGQGRGRSGGGAAAAEPQQQEGQSGEEGPQAGAWDTEVRLRGGVIQQAVVLEALSGAGPHDGGGGGGGQAVQLLAMGSGGLLPKLDMYWLLRYMFGWPTTPALWRDDGRLDGSQAWVAAALQRLTGGSAGAAAGLASRLLRALHFTWQQAVGRPAGAHAAFKGAGVDAAGVRLVPGRLDRWAGTARPIRATDPDAPAFSSFSASSSSSASSPSAVSALEERALSLASGLELTLRSLNNLVERVHHSSFLYLLAGLDRYVSVERYVGPAAALALVVQLQAAWSMWVLRLAAAAPGGAAVGPSGAAGGPSGGAGPAAWAEAAARAAARTAACAAAAMALRVLACGDGPWAARLLVQLAPPAAVGALRAALAAPLSSPTGAAAAAAVMLLTAAAASGAAALAGRLVATAVPRRRTSSSSGAHSAAAAAGAAGAGAARAAACGVTATDASGSGDGSLPQSWGADAAAGSAATALSLRWHAERVLVLTATAAALAALVCLNWAAAAVAGFYLAKLAVAQGLAAAAAGYGCGGTRLRVPGQPKKQGQGQGLGAAVAERELAAAGRPLRQRSALGWCVAAVAWALGGGLWLLASPLTALVVVVLLTEAVGLGGGLRSGGGLAAAADSALGWGVGPGVCVGLSAANYWFAAVVAAPLWLFGLEGWLAQAQLRL